MWRVFIFALLLAMTAAALGCANEFGVEGVMTDAGLDAGLDAGPDTGPPPVGDDAGAVVFPVPDGPVITGLHVVGARILDGQGHPITLHGVNRSGTEYRCAQNGGIFDGPADEASVAAIATWKANAVRVPLNESCWLAINGSPDAFSGDIYKTAIKDYVALLHKYHLVPILELHWVGPGATLALRQQPMPDADHAPAFWADVAATFSDDDGIVFEPYNEPFPDSNRESAAAWSCWRNGCPAVRQAGATGPTPPTYTAAGMQDLVSSIRQGETGAPHVLLLGGIQYSNDLLHWLDNEPTDPRGNLGAAWHVYNYNACVDASCWDGAPAAVAAAVPVVATEIGEDDCSDGFISPLMAWLDAKSAGYLAWSWNNFSMCQAASRTDAGYSRGNPYSLITDYASGMPNSTYAQTFHDHLAGL